MVELRLIGDVHGQLDKYIKIASKSKYSVQLGDMGFCYGELIQLNHNNHFFLGGNHDNYDIVDDWPHYMGDYGTLQLEGQTRSVFFIRGAYSIDKHYRTIGVDWWEQEELNYEQSIKCLEHYQAIKPDIILSHDCPYTIAEKYFEYKDRPRTRMLLDAMYYYHQPELWVNGHHHVRLDETYILNGKETRFIMLEELGYIDIDI